MNERTKAVHVMMDRAMIVLDAALHVLRNEPADTSAEFPARPCYERDYIAIDELRKLSKEGKHFLGHHLMNSMAAVVGFSELGRGDQAIEAAYQLADVLRLIGCNVIQREVPRGADLKTETDPAVRGASS
jgi:hypothetical protein